MKVVVTGATGFVGRHLVGELLHRSHAVTAVARTEDRFHAMPWADQVEFVAADVKVPSQDLWRRLGKTGLLIHLAWPGLPNYRDNFHFEQNLPAAYDLVRQFVAGGCPRVLVTGTCFEYGHQNGQLSESRPTQPTTAYGLGKDVLHRFLTMLQSTSPFQLSWARLFYMYGPGQNPNSLIAQLDAAIDRGDRVFNMSGGQQLRDFLAVSDVASALADIAEDSSFDGTVNVCSGRPTSVRSIVEDHLRDRSASLELNLGHYPYPDYEPFAFWGDRSILDSIQREENR